MLPSENDPKTSTHIRSPIVDSRIKPKDDQESQDGPSSGGGLGDEAHLPKEQTGADKEVVLDVALEEQLGAETVCRICHLSGEISSGRSELIQLGCHCKEELGISHRDCAEAWFKQRGNSIFLTGRSGMTLNCGFTEVSPPTVSSLTVLQQYPNKGQQVLPYTSFVVFAFWLICNVVNSSFQSISTT